MAERQLEDVEVATNKDRTKFLEALKETARQARLPFDRDMLLNLAFFADYQYTEWVNESKLLRSIPIPSGERNSPRPVVNKIMHFVMQEHASVMQNRPTVDVLPASDEPTDLSTSSVADAYLRWFADPTQADFEAELSDASYWALIAGEGYLKWTFDPKENRPNVESVSPLDIFADPYAKKFSQARYIIQETFMDVSDVENIYGVKVEASSADSSKVALLKEMGHAPVLSGAVVNELWVKPGAPNHPDGALIVWSGKHLLLYRDKFPYAHGQLPYTQLGSVPRPNTPHYTCAVKYLRAPQMELNLYHAQKITTRKNFANPKWWIPEELELQHPPDNSPNQVLRGNSMGGTLRPEIIQGDLMQDNDDGTWIGKEMMDVVGLHEVSQAQVPGRVEAAKAIELLKESHQSRLDEMERTIRNAITLGFWQALMLAKQYVSTEQIVHVYSPEGYPEVHKFKTDNFKPGMRIRVLMGTGLARSRAARQEYAMLLWQNQVITDPEVFANIVDIPVDTIAPARANDIRLARNENLEMASTEAGVAITPNSWDAHDIHIREHNNYRKTLEFREASQEVKQKFEYHVTMHEQLEMEQLRKQAMKAAALGGIDPATLAENPPGAAEEPPQPEAPAPVESDSEVPA